ncbi:MAG TPA: helix-turn-helix transcriptional regulator [Solimonas sp.]
MALDLTLAMPGTAQHWTSKSALVRVRPQSRHTEDDWRSVRSLNQHLVLKCEGGECCGGNHMSALSKREKQAFFMTVMGLSVRRIAAEMGVKYKTAETHRHGALVKLDLKGAVEAVHYAVLHGYLSASAEALCPQGDVPDRG